MEVVREGEILASKYRVERVLGRGGMGVVVLAQHLQLGQHVALKFLLPAACSNPEAVARFLREGRAAVQIQSEHVARVSDVGQLESGAPFMVMEFLRGADLGQVLAERGPLPIAEAVDYVLQASEAIAEAHSLGIVHRDLKPANLFLARRPDGSPLVKVLDFGISKAAQVDATGAPMNLTATAALMGSPLYMSPEQVRNVRDVDARADIWSLGVIIHELLAGSAPFNADTAPALFAMITADPPLPLRHSRPDAPLELEQAVLRCLEKSRERRYSSVAELARALRPFGSRDGATSAERISRILGVHPQAGTPGGGLSGSSAAPAATAGTGGAWGTTNRDRKRSRWGVVVTVTGFVAISAGVAAWYTMRSAPGSPDEAAASAGVKVPAPEIAHAPPPLLPSVPVLAVSNAPTAATMEPPPGPIPSASEPPIVTTRPKPLRAAAPRIAVSAKAPVKESAPASPRRPKDLFDDTQ